MFAITGGGLTKIKYMQNDNKRPRWSVDQWDRQSETAPQTEALSCWLISQRFTDDSYTVMDRDRRLTGRLRGQSDEVEAPLGFELNNPWRVSALVSPVWMDGVIFEGSVLTEIA